MNSKFALNITEQKCLNSLYKTYKATIRHLERSKSIHSAYSVNLPTVNTDQSESTVVAGLDTRIAFPNMELTTLLFQHPFWSVFRVNKSNK